MSCQMTASRIERFPIDAVVSYAKAELHDGDVFMVRVNEPTTETQLRAFRRQLFDEAQRLEFERRGILCLVVSGDVDLVKADGPIRFEPVTKKPVPFDEARAAQAAYKARDKEQFAPGFDNGKMIRAVMAGVKAGLQNDV